MSTYLDSGFDTNFQREITPNNGYPPNNMFSGLSTMDTNSVLQGLSASNLSGGQFRSKDGNLVLDLEKGFLVISSSGVERIRFGYDENTGETGMVLHDQNSNEIARITEKKNFIQSPDQGTIFDFDNNRIAVYENGVMRVLIGYDSGGF